MTKITHPIITASNGTKLTVEDLKYAIEGANVNWTMAKFAYRDLEHKTPLDICMADFFRNQSSWQCVDHIFMEDYEFWNKKQNDDEDTTNPLIKVIEWRADVEWTYLAKNKGWNHLMTPFTFKQYCKLNLFEKTIYNEALTAGFKYGYSEFKEGKGVDYWRGRAVFDNRHFLLTAALPNSKPSFIDENTFISIDQGKRFRVRLLLR